MLQASNAQQWTQVKEYITIMPEKLYLSWVNYLLRIVIL